MDSPLPNTNVDSPSALTEDELDKLSRVVLREVMGTDKFQKLWINLCEKTELEEKKLQRVNSASRSKHICDSESEPCCSTSAARTSSMDSRKASFAVTEEDQQGARSTNDSPLLDYPTNGQSKYHPSLKQNTILIHAMEQLTEHINVAIETFRRGVQLAYSNLSTKNGIARSSLCNSKCAFSSLLYSVKIRLDRFCNSGRFHPAKFSLIARQLAYLQRHFSNFVSCPFNFETCKFLASSLYDLLQRFVEYCSLFEESSAHKGSLEIATNNFGQVVCNKLNKMSVLFHQRFYSRPRRSDSLAQVSLGRPITRFRSNPTLDQLLSSESPQRRRTSDKSFLISPELEYDRNKTSITNLAKPYQCF